MTPIAPRGIEHSALALSKTPISEKRGTESGTVSAPNSPKDPDLAFIETRWPTLPEHVRQAVLALVKSATAKDESE